jgi:hypothetical protein
LVFLKAKLCILSLTVPEGTLKTLLPTDCTETVVRATI